ncbi:hypothetical protein [Streptomyces sp. NPDC052225]|uniref:hypothetical protein n=1 Tax=Streptomyces sp. NPDC052225 TaxID=3154949 RepID=UPI003413C510
MSASERAVRPGVPRPVSMRELLAAGAAARAVSTPPVAPRVRRRDDKVRPDAV